MTDDLRDRLHDLARLAPDAPLDLPAAAGQGRRRKARRRATQALSAAALLLAAPLAWSAAAGGGDRLAQQPAAPAVSDAPPLTLQATARAEIVADDGQPRLAVEAGGQLAPLADGGDFVMPEGLHLTFTTLTGQDESFWPYPAWIAQATADEGSGVLGLGGVCGPGWDRDGQPITDDPCSGASVVAEAQPGVPVQVPLVLYSKVGDGRTLPGTYRSDLELRDGDTLRVSVQVTERTPSVDPPADPLTSPSPPSSSTSLSEWDTANAFLSPQAATLAEQPGWAVVPDYPPGPFVVLDACRDRDMRYSESQIHSLERRIASQREAGGSQLTQEVTQYFSQEVAEDVFIEHVDELRQCPTQSPRQDPSSTIRHEVVARRTIDGGQSMLVREQPCGSQGGCTAHFAYYVMVVQIGNGVTLAEYTLLEDGDPAQDAESLLTAVEQALRAAVPRSS